MAGDVQRIVSALRAEIAEGRFSEEDALPSLRDLARRHATSVYAARRAIDALVARNLVESRRGSGVYVTKRGKERRIGIVLPGLAYSDFFRPLAERLAELCARGGYRAVMPESWPENSQRRTKETLQFVHGLIRAKVAGVIFQPLEHFPKADYVNRKIAAALDEAEIPLVLIDSDIVPPPDRSRYDVVGINNHDAGVRVAEHLLAQGVTEIRFLLGPDADWNIRSRLRGVADAVRMRGAGWNARNELTCSPSDARAIRRVLAARPKPQAFVCRGDATALELMKTLEKIGRRVPKDVLVVGFDDIPAAVGADPPLTTIRQPSAAIAAAAFRALVGRISVPTLPPCEIYLPAPLVVRASTAAASPRV